MIALKSLVSLLILLPVGASSSPLAAGEDPRAAALAESVLEALGGEEAWDETRFIRFTFAGRRTHWWDRFTGRHRLEGTTREGERYVVLHHLDTREGKVWLQGEELEGEAAEEWLERAYGAWVNDTYWLLMPYKLMDPGVHLSYEGTREVDGESYEVLQVSFEDVGLTPGDRYFVYVDPETHLVKRWAYVLESFEPGQEPTHWVWSGWERHGDILLAPQRRDPESGRELPLDDIAVFHQLPERVFESPEPVEPE